MDNEIQVVSKPPEFKRRSQ